MPLATELLPLLEQKLELEEMQQWLGWLGARIKWLSEANDQPSLSIEQVFHLANFDIEIHRLQQHLAPVGRHDGPGTPWGQAESIKAWLSYLEDALRDVILERQDEANVAPITRFAEALAEGDAVMTFNYDTLVERALVMKGTSWNHGLSDGHGTNVFKMHGSIDWIVAHRKQPRYDKLDLIFDKTNENRSSDDQAMGHVEEDFLLWRCRTAEQLRKWIAGRDLQFVPDGASPNYVGIAGLGSYKQLHQIPGLGRIWINGMNALRKARLAVVVGFSMSDFDAMAQMQFAEVARDRVLNGNPLHVVVIDPYLNDQGKRRFQRVFRSVEFIDCPHEQMDWGRL